MSEAKHTPGAWLIAPTGKTFVYALNDQGYNRFWAHVQGGNTAPMESTTDDELAANARLIAAAPDLLGALQMLYDETADYIRLNNLGGMDNQCMQMARAALAKATGAAS